MPSKRVRQEYGQEASASEKGRTVSCSKPPLFQNFWMVSLSGPTVKMKIE